MPKQGTSTGSMEYSPARLTRIKRAMARQEKRWEKKSGPVVVKFVCPICSGPHAKAEHPA